MSTPTPSQPPQADRQSQLKLLIAKGKEQLQLGLPVGLRGL